MKTKWKIVTSVACSLVTASGAFAVTGAMRQDSPVASNVTFSVLNRPRTAVDAQATKGLTGQSVPMQAGSVRLIGKDAAGNQYLVGRGAKADQICVLVVVQSDWSARGTCESESNIRTKGLWVQFGNSAESYMAIVVPDQYKNSVVETQNSIITENADLVVVSTTRGPGGVTLKSDRYAPLKMTSTH